MLKVSLGMRAQGFRVRTRSSSTSKSFFSALLWTATPLTAAEPFHGRFYDAMSASFKLYDAGRCREALSTAQANPLALRLVAKIYLEGCTEIKADPARGEALMKEALDRGDTAAAVDLGILFDPMSEPGHPKDFQLAERYYKMGIAGKETSPRNRSVAKSNLAIMYMNEAAVKYGLGRKASALWDQGEQLHNEVYGNFPDAQQWRTENAQWMSDARRRTHALNGRTEKFSLQCNGNLSGAAGREAYSATYQVDLAEGRYQERLKGELHSPRRLDDYQNGTIVFSNNNSSQMVIDEKYNEKSGLWTYSFVSPPTGVQFTGLMRCTKGPFEGFSGS